MIQSVTIKNFKSFREATLPLAPLTVLIGANASGKSNAIEAMQLLSWLYIKPPPERSSLCRPWSRNSLCEEDLQTLAVVTEKFLSAGEVEGPDRSGGFSISFQVTEQGLRITSEQMLLGTTISLHSARRNSFSQMSRNLFEHLENQLVPSCFFLDPDPRRMREYRFIQEKRL